MKQEITLHTNKLYLGDPCYVIKGHSYDQICAGNDGANVPGLGICLPTGHGDLEMLDDECHTYDFDSGQFAVLDAHYCDLTVKKDASFFERMFVDGLKTIDVPGGVAHIIMHKDDDSIIVHIEDETTGDILYHSCISYSHIDDIPDDEE